jgi:hypothetical protein
VGVGLQGIGVFDGVESYYPEVHIGDTIVQEYGPVEQPWYPATHETPTPYLSFVPEPGALLSASLLVLLRVRLRRPRNARLGAGG